MWYEIQPYGYSEAIDIILEVVLIEFGLERKVLNHQAV